MAEYEAAKVKCKSCRKYRGCSGLNRVHCINNDNVFFEGFTNADRIRAMSDEKLAAWLYNVCCIEEPFECPALSNPQKNVDCREIWLDWLRQEANE